MEETKVRKVQKGHGFYSLAFKQAVCEEYISSGMSKEYISRKYGIEGKCTLLKWLRKFGYIDYQLPKPSPIKPMPHKDDHQDIEQLRRKIKELEQSLEQSQLEKEAWKKMIEVAERDLKINIQKKSDTKQSGK
jgi:transposase-like protein